MHDWCSACVARQVQTEGKFNGFKGLRLAVTTINGSRYCGICAAREIPSPEKLAAIVTTEARALFQGFLETLSDEVYGRFEHELSNVGGVDPAGKSDDSTTPAQGIATPSATQRSGAERGDAGTAASDADPAVPTSPYAAQIIDETKRLSSWAERDGMGT